ncbi:zf-HC2 domain-containing protein [Archangium lansingense]|uniref:Zf-HC2 domain-containing protein n=1 Tax=Archangium lansingense TaxID=2995310 RepID=A0ABT4A273_9BACT|nr:zf-HC2 domain-containing protein [Archangium lansinium]MCY1075750.1 zf-HC2 domain-containing protein [Archangium lansinium]
MSEQPHLTAEMAAQYLHGLLEPQQRSFFEAHASQCDACARVLQREALAEVKLRGLARSEPSAPKRLLARSKPRLLLAVAGLAAAALALLLLRFQVFHPASSTQPTGAGTEVADQVIQCLSGDNRSACPPAAPYPDSSKRNSPPSRDKAEAQLREVPSDKPLAPADEYD